MKLSAAIFDLDGTVIDSEGAWGKAFHNILKSLGIDARETHPEEVGVEVKENWRRLLIRFDIKTEKTLDDLRSLTYSEYMNFIPEISINDGVLEFIENLKDSGALVALATSTSWEVTNKVLNSLKIEELFTYITTGEEVINEKPAPDIFLMAAEKMNLDPENCLVLEDSHSGVEAASEAEMKVIAIDPEEKDSKSLSKANLVVGGFSEISVKIIEEL
jgi:HAD superfamily hydrolase (TIGR01509 family)